VVCLQAGDGPGRFLAALVPVGAVRDAPQALRALNFRGPGFGVFADPRAVGVEPAPWVYTVTSIIKSNTYSSMQLSDGRKGKPLQPRRPCGRVACLET
jgi:hypothetical protein